jgi:hypothetical protein
MQAAIRGGQALGDAGAARPRDASVGGGGYGWDAP